MIADDRGTSRLGLITNGIGIIEVVPVLPVSRQLASVTKFSLYKRIRLMPNRIFPFRSNLLA